MTSLALSLILLSTPQDDNWKTYRVGETGLKLNLPAEPTIVKTAEETQLTCTYKSAVVSIIASQKNIDQAQPVSQAHSEKMGFFREKYGRKIKSFLNESPVVEADMFGAPESIGFVLEVDEGGGKVNAWQRVLVDGWEYDISVDCDRRDQAVMEKILASAQYVDPATGDFRVTPLGGTGLQSYLGIAFMPQDDVARPNATSVVLNTDLFPAMMLATVWQNEEVDYENPEQLKKAMTKWVSGFVQGAQSEITLTPKKSDDQTTYEIKGNVNVQGIEVIILGKAFARRDDAQVVIAVIESRQEGGQEFAKKVLATVSQIPKND